MKWFVVLWSVFLLPAYCEVETATWSKWFFFTPSGATPLWNWQLWIWQQALLVHSSTGWIWSVDKKKTFNNFSLQIFYSQAQNFLNVWRLTYTVNLSVQQQPLCSASWPDICDGKTQRLKCKSCTLCLTTYCHFRYHSGSHIKSIQRHDCPCKLFQYVHIDPVGSLAVWRNSLMTSSKMSADTSRLSSM